MTTSAEYGRRDMFAPGAIVERPDGTVFRQGHLPTYRRTTVPAVLPPADRSNRLDNVARRPAKEGSMTNTMGQALVDAGSVISRFETGRRLSETGRSWLITLEAPGLGQVTISRLRSHREGNGF